MNTVYTHFGDDFSCHMTELNCHSTERQCFHCNTGCWCILSAKLLSWFGIFIYINVCCACSSSSRTHFCWGHWAHLLRWMVTFLHNKFRFSEEVLSKFKGIQLQLSALCNLQNLSQPCFIIICSTVGNCFTDANCSHQFCA